MAITIEALHAALPETMADEGELDAVLRRIGRVPDHDHGKLDGMRAVVIHNKLVVQAPDGKLVKGELPTPQSFAEAETERMAKLAAEERRQRELLHPPEKYVNPMRVQTEAFITEIIGERYAALEEQVSDLREQVSDLQQQVDVLITHEIAA